MIGVLPRDVVLSILRLVDDARTLSACQRVNKAWCELVVQNRLWESPFVGFDWRLFLDFTGLFDVALNSSLLEWFRAVDKSVWAPVWDLEWAQAADRTMSVVLEGIEGAGKSSCVVQFVNGIFVESYDPTIEDSYRMGMAFGTAPSLLMDILDTAGSDSIQSMRDFSRKNSVALLVPVDNFERGLEYAKKILADLVPLKERPTVLLVLSKYDLSPQYPGLRLGELRTLAVQFGCGLCASSSKCDVREPTAPNVCSECMRSNTQLQFVCLKSRLETEPRPMCRSCRTAAQSSKLGWRPFHSQEIFAWMYLQYLRRRYDPARKDKISPSTGKQCIVS